MVLICGAVVLTGVSLVALQYAARFRREGYAMREEARAEREEAQAEARRIRFLLVGVCDSLLADIHERQERRSA